MGSPDDAVKWLVQHGGTQSDAARKTGCCPMALSRAIRALKDQGAWEAHVADVRATLDLAEAPAEKDLDLPSPKSLGAQIKSGATRLGDGRPYMGKGGTWGEYREGHKMAMV